MALNLPGATVATSSVNSTTGSSGLRLPGYVPPLPPRPAINRSATTPRELQATVIAEGAVVPLVYGRVRIGPMVGAVRTSGSKLVMLLLWCMGPVDAVEDMAMDGDALPGDVTITHYLGTTTQTADPTLSALISGYADTLIETRAGVSRGWCYSVVQVPSGDSRNVPRFEAQIRGFKVYDPRDVTQLLNDPATWKWSQNPALCWADFESNAFYGAGRIVDWDSVETLADVADETLVDGSKRRVINLALAQRSRVEDWSQTFREYAGGYVKKRADVIHFVPDRPVSVAAADTGTSTDATATTLTDTSKAWTVDEFIGYKCVITSGPGQYLERRIASNTADTLTLESRWGDALPIASDYQIWERTAGAMVQDSLRLSKRGLRDVPTVMRIVYTNTTTNPWQDAEATDASGKPPQLSGVSSGTVPRRDSIVHLEGITTNAQAYRAGQERLNKLTLTDLEATWIAFDDALEVEVGDVLPLTHPIGLVVKLMRIVSVDPIDLGRWSIGAAEYDPAVYSNQVVSEPTFGDTTLPSPLNPPAPTDVAITEELFQDQAERTFSRIRVTWTGKDFPFATGYRAVVNGDGIALEATIQHRGTVQHSAVTGPVKQGIVYTADVYTLTSVGISEVPGTANLTAQGKLLKPTDVAEITGFEAGQFTSLSWTAAIDIDLIGYKIKRGTTGSTWETADTVIAERVDATTFLANAQPEGTWRYYIKSIDSVGQESENAAYVDVVVTGDSSNAVLSHQSTVALATLVNMHSYEVSGQARYAITSYGQTWSQRFGAAGSTWGANGTKPWCLGHPDTAAAYVETGEWDISIDRNGNWKWDAVVNLIQSGTGVAAKTESILMSKSADYPTFTEFSGRSTVKTARYYKAKILDGGNNGDAAIRVRFPIQDSLIGTIIKKSGTANIPVSPQPLTVTFAEQYAGAPKVTLVTTGTSPRIVAADNITATGFDLYAWDAAGVAAAATVEWSAEGN